MVSRAVFRSRLCPSGSETLGTAHGFAGTGRSGRPVRAAAGWPSNAMKYAPKAGACPAHRHGAAPPRNPLLLLMREKKIRQDTRWLFRSFRPEWRLREDRGLRQKILPGLFYRNKSLVGLAGAPVAQNPRAVPPVRHADIQACTRSVHDASAFLYGPRLVLS